MDGTEIREELYQLNKDRLSELAHRGLTKGMGPDQFFVIAIDVDDPSWTDLVEELMPGQNWDSIRALGQIPVARGIVYPVVLDYLSGVVPDIAPALKCELPEGMIRAVILAAGGGSVYFIEPIPQGRFN